MPLPDDVQLCPYCGKEIKAVAVKCRYCGEFLDDNDVEDEALQRQSKEDAEKAVKWLIPIGRSGWAVASGYLGLLSCFPFVGLLFGIAAVITGILALRHARKNPKMGGRGRAIFGIILGIVGIIFWGVGTVALIQNYLTSRK